MSHPRLICGVIRGLFLLLISPVVTGLYVRLLFLLVYGDDLIEVSRNSLCIEVEDNFIRVKFVDPTYPFLLTLLLPLTPSWSFWTSNPEIFRILSATISEGM